MSEAGDPRMPPDAVQVLEELVDDVARDPSDRDVRRRLDWLVETLVRRGFLTPSNRALVNRIKGEASVVRLALYPDKRAVPSTERDCASLLHLCKGRCCAMDVSLSAEDVAEGKLRWDLQRPYVLPRKPEHGYCACLGDAGGCTVYDDRPGTCRAYDCADDPRVWLDWERKIPAPLPWHQLAPDEWPARTDEGGDGGDQGGDAGPTTSAG